MSRTGLLLLVFLVVTSVLSALPAELTAEGNPTLYQSLREKALDNLSLLPRNRQRGYQGLLERYPDALMAYLIAYEPDANLAMSNHHNIYSNYLATAEVLEYTGLHYSPEFFLSYVAKITVSDEPISLYRSLFLNHGLGDILVNYPDITERYRQVALWCVEKLRFQPTSGRDQSPVDIAFYSLTGRCEEMQILFVAAARTVGIPSRPASTPWWAHIDNNHAWAEIFIDGGWHYTGDMDGAYFPDQTWFSGMIDKTVLILADGSLAAEGEEVLGRGRYDTTINSIRNYAKERTRTISIRSQNSDGTGIDDLLITPLVYNWGSLRAITTMQADSLGSRTLSVGRGAFFLMLSKGEERALVPVPSGSSNLLILAVSGDAPVGMIPISTKIARLSTERLPDQDLVMDYPGNEMNWQQAPESWNLAANEAKARIAAELEAFETRSLPPLVEPSDSLFATVYRGTRGKWCSFLDFYDAYDSLPQDFLELLAEGDPKLLWQANSYLLEALYNFYREHKDKLATLSPEDRQILFDPVVYFEELPFPFKPLSKRPQLYPGWFRVRGYTDMQKTERVVAKLSRRFRIDASKALSGLLPLHIAAQQRYLNGYQFRILVVSALKANGIPAQFSRIPDTIEVLLDSEWQYYNVTTNCIFDPSQSTEEESVTRILKITDQEGSPLHLAPEQMNLSIVSGQQLYPVNREISYKGNGYYEAPIPTGGIFLQIGYRVSESRTIYKLSWLEPGEEAFAISLEQYPKAWVEADPATLALLEGVDTTGFDAIVLGHYAQENSIRIMNKILESVDRVLFLDYGSVPDAGVHRTAPAWQELVQQDDSNAQRTITLIRSEDGWQAYEGFWERLPSED
ncbi:MAG: transglutaminase-like domain-containing protein [Candidatus Cloacimonadota bacterium]